MLKVDLAMQKQQLAQAQQMAEKLAADNPNSLSALMTHIKVYLA